jgi:hypothetical protein
MELKMLVSDILSNLSSRCPISVEVAGAVILLLAVLSTTGISKVADMVGYDVIL